MQYNRKRKSLAELLYQPGDPELVAYRDETTRKLHAYNSMDPLDRKGREAAIRTILGGAGTNPVVEQPLFCTHGYNTTVGDNFFLNVNCKLLDAGRITIGSNVFIAPNVCIITEEHSMNTEECIAGLEYTHPVMIGNNVWICAGALILPGVTIGEGSVIGAGSGCNKRHSAALPRCGKSVPRDSRIIISQATQKADMYSICRHCTSAFFIFVLPSVDICIGASNFKLHNLTGTQPHARSLRFTRLSQLTFYYHLIRCST